VECLRHFACNTTNKEIINKSNNQGGLDMKVRQLKKRAKAIVKQVGLVVKVKNILML
jgi:hypothetical protein